MRALNSKTIRSWSSPSPREERTGRGLGRGAVYLSSVHEGGEGIVYLPLSNGWNQNILKSFLKFKSAIHIFTLLSFLSFSIPRAHAQPPAFPGAQGFGAYATGGRGGTVYHVTSLNDSGAGSFRDAVSQSKRIIVFDVGGYIVLNSAVSCANNLTIAGQTAPGDGIGIMGHEVSFSAKTNEIVRFLRIRPGSIAGSTEDAINCGDGTNMIFDHISLEFAPYNNLDAHGNVGANQITVQNSIFADPIGQQFNAHTEALKNTFSWCYNILSSAHNRNPLAKVNTIFINNVIYNFQAGYTVADTSGHFTHDIINNYFIAGPSTSSPGDDFFQMDSNQQIYSAGNLLDSDRNGALGGSSTAPGSVVALSSPWSPVTATIPTFPVATAYKNAVSISGTLPRDQVDKLVLTDVTSRGSSGQMWTTQTATGLGNSGYGAINGGVPLVDTDGDGLPDIWETAVGLNPNNASDGATINADGYSQLEEYFNWLALPHAIVPTNVPTDIDLWLYTLGFTNGATYALSNFTNCTVTITNNHIAHFIPAANFTGLAGFTFNVVDNTGASFTNNFGLLVTAVHVPQNLVWRGDGLTNTWNTTNFNWFNGDSLVAFSAGDTVTFDDSGSDNPAITLPGSVAPASMIVNASQDYTFIGNGLITGSMSLTKSGTGNLILNTTNGYSGGTVMNGGTLTLGNASAIGGSSLTFNGGILSLTGAGGPATYNNAVTLNAPMTLLTPGSGNNNQALGGAITGSANLSINTASGGTFSARGSLTGYSGTILLTSPGNFRFQGSSGSASTAFDLGTNGAIMFARDGGTITLGSLSGAANTFLRGAGSTAASTTYIIGGNNSSTTFAGTITNGNVSGVSEPTAITKNGTGTWTLTGTNNYTGTTTVSNGTLVISSNNGPSPVTVASGGTLTGTGPIGGLVTVNTSGKFAPGLGGGTTTVGSLTLNGASLLFDLANVTSVGNGVNDLISLTGGALTLTGITAVMPNFLNGTLTNGTYTLINGGTSVSGGPANLVLSGSAGGRQTFTFDTTTSPGSLILNVGGSPAASLVWQGTNGNNWDTTTTNWLHAGIADKFFSLDAVTFDDTSTNGNVNIIGIVQPGVITVTNSTLAYSFGAGQIGGTTKFLKSGNGTATLNTANTYTGGTIITGGTLVTVTNSTLGSGPVTLAGGTLVSSGGNLSNALICLGSGGLIGNNVNNFTFVSPVSGNGTLTLTPMGKLITIQSDFSGFTGTVTLTGSGSLRFNPPGNLIWGNSNALFDAGASGSIKNRSLNPITVYLGALAGASGSQLQGSDQTNNPGSIDTYIVGNLNTNTAFAGSIQDGSTHLVALQKIGNSTLTLSGNNPYTAGTTVAAGTLLVNNSTGSATGPGVVNVTTGATLGGNGIIAGTVTIAASGTLSPGNVNTIGILTLNSDLSMDDASVLQFKLDTTSDQVIVGGDLTLGGTLNLTNLGALHPGSYTLFTYARTLTLGNLLFGALPPGYFYSLNTSTAGQVNLIVSRPQFLTAQSINGALTLTGSGGNPGGPYYILTSTNLAAPLINWTPIATNSFDSLGNFAFTNSINAAQSQQFYLLQTP